MLKISKETRLRPVEILERASQYFGESGLGLDEKDRNPCCIYFEGAGGYLSLSLINEDKYRTVEIETREWDHHAKKFLGLI